MVTAPSSAREVSVGLALHADEGLRAATHRLFEAGSVEAVSWSFEGGLARVPTWLRGLLDCYGAHGRLTLHGVAMSPLTARPHAASRRTWLAQLEECATRLHAAQVSEHFGFCAAGEVAFGAPLPVPWSRAALAAGRRALSELASA